MIIGITLDGIISSKYRYAGDIDDDLYCLNQNATESGWYASNRWFAKGHDVLFFTSRGNQSSTNRWLEEWNLTYNKISYNIEENMHSAYAESVGCDIVVLGHVDNTSKLSLSCISFLLAESIAVNVAAPNVHKLTSLDDLDRVIDRWPISKKDFIANPVE
jgi:hypothetical protein